IQDHRVEERKRQRERRDKLAAMAASASTVEPGGTRIPPHEAPCHAPPSGRNTREIADKMLEEWDRRHTLSRATLQRWIARFLRRSEASGGTPGEVPVPLSRATLDV